MRFVWTDAGDDPSFDVGDRHGIDGYFMPLWDSLTTREFLVGEVQRRGHVAGVYVGAGWHNAWSPAQYAQNIDREVARLNVPGLRVMFNLEEHNPERIARILEEWRNIRRRRYTSTSWSPEGMQGGWMGDAFVQRVLACRVRVVPQAFIGDMTRRAEDMVLRDLVRRGFPEQIVSIFYDAAQLPLDWQGYAFRMGRLPLP